jgi:hypothetical protein
LPVAAYLQDYPIVHSVGVHSVRLHGMGVRSLDMHCMGHHGVNVPGMGLYKTGLFSTVKKLYFISI